MDKYIYIKIYKRMLNRLNNEFERFRSKNKGVIGNMKNI